MALQANELRVGNFLLYNGNILKVTCIDLDLDDEGVALVCFQDSNPVELNYGKVLPIPLTPEILKKCGSQQKSIMGTNEPHWKIGNYLLSDSEINRMGSLHFLQNWYYFKTFGEELNYQP